MNAPQPSAPEPADDDLVTGVEAFLLGRRSRGQVDEWLDKVLQRTIGTGLAEVLFRSGRIDAVYAVATTDAEQVLVKVHRPPLDVAARAVVARAQRALADAGFPCARPLAGPTTIDGHMVSVETLLPDGERGDGHDPAIRRAVAQGLAEQIEILATVPDLAANVGRPPAWACYQDGAWPPMHDPAFELDPTPTEYTWLDDFAQQASSAILAASHDEPTAVAHADWYCGNLRFAGSRLVAAFDWDLMADTTPVVAGITAGMFSAGTSAVATPPEPAEVAAFLSEFEDAHGARFSAEQQRTAAAAASWNISYAARCDITNFTGRPVQHQSALDLLHRRRAEYLALRW